MRFAVVVPTVAVACVLAGRTVADERAPVDLPALLEEVDRTSPVLLGARARAESAATLAPQREALPDPTLQAAYTNDGLSRFTLGDSEFSNLTIGWEQEVPDRSVRARAAAVATAQAETLRASSATASAQVRARVIALYAELWRIDHTRTLLHESRTLLATAAMAAQARYESGEGIQEGLIRAQTAVRRVDVQIAELALDRRQAEIALGAALGRAANPEFGPANELPELADPVAAEDMAAAAAVGSPDVLESVSRVRAAEAELDNARVQTKPSFSWMAAYQFRGGLDPMVAGGFSVRLPVWKNRKQAHAVAGAELEHEAAAFNQAQSEILARAAARGLAAEIDSLDDRARLYREAIVPQSAAAFESANAAFASGRAEMSLVLDDLDRWIVVRKDELVLSAQRVEKAATLEAITGKTLLTLTGMGRTP
jgi:outer membrane protein TolC